GPVNNGYALRVEVRSLASTNTRSATRRDSPTVAPVTTANMAASFQVVCPSPGFPGTKPRRLVHVLAVSLRARVATPSPTVLVIPAQRMPSSSPMVIAYHGRGRQPGAIASRSPKCVLRFSHDSEHPPDHVGQPVPHRQLRSCAGGGDAHRSQGR